jgi:hypothetical protein
MSHTVTLNLPLKVTFAKTTLMYMKGRGCHISSVDFSFQY